MYNYKGVSVYWPLSVLCVCVCVCVCMCVCVISNQGTSKKSYVSDLSKRDAFLHKTHIKDLQVLRYQGSTCVDPYYLYTIYYYVK